MYASNSLRRKKQISYRVLVFPSSNNGLHVQAQIIKLLKSKRVVFCIDSFVFFNNVVIDGHSIGARRQRSHAKRFISVDFDCVDYVV